MSWWKVQKSPGAVSQHATVDAKLFTYVVAVAAGCATFCAGRSELNAVHQ
jgi:hypothetical protein